jgi:hypothetical protein
MGLIFCGDRSNLDEDVNRSAGSSTEEGEESASTCSGQAGRQAT